MEKTQEILGQINLLLHLLQSAGYGVASLDIELSLPPKVTMKLKTGPAVKEGRVERDFARSRQPESDHNRCGVVDSGQQAARFSDRRNARTRRSQATGGWPSLPISTPEGAALKLSLGGDFDVHPIR